LSGGARESEEKLGNHEVTMRIPPKMRRGGLLLRERGRGEPPCMLSKCHLHAREANSKLSYNENSSQNEERWAAFKGKRERRTPLHALQVSPPCKRGPLQGWRTVREGTKV
jgi:hypothetical protein